MSFPSKDDFKNRAGNYIYHKSRRAYCKMSPGLIILVSYWRGRNFGRNTHLIPDSYYFQILYRYILRYKYKYNVFSFKSRAQSIKKVSRINTKKFQKGNLSQHTIKKKILNFNMKIYKGSVRLSSNQRGE